MQYKPVFGTEQTLGITLNPLDVLFFRDGRPFEASSRGRGGLPQPQTLMGMILGHLRRCEGITHSEKHGMRCRPEDQRHWVSWVAVRGPWLAKVNADGTLNDVYFPAPAHLVTDKDGETSGLLQPTRMDLAKYGWKEKADDAKVSFHPLVSERIDGKPSGKWLNSEGLKAVINGEIPKEEDFVDDSKIFCYEDRTGIGIDPSSGTADDEKGLIYSARFLRLHKDIRIYAEVGIDSNHLTSNGHDNFTRLKNHLKSGDLTMRFGGESRRVHLHTLAKPHVWPEAAPTPGPDEGGFTTILLTPSIFGTGKNCHGDPRMPCHLGALCSAAVPDPTPISGWTTFKDENDNVMEAARPTRYAVPAGAVYFWQTGKNGNGQAAQTGMYSLASKPAERAGGFGTAIRGIWKWAK